MKRNVGKGDRALRVAVGIGLLSCTVIGPQTWWGLVGLVPLATAIRGG